MTSMEVDILRKFGIKVPRSQVSETYALIASDPELSQEIEKIKESFGTMNNEDTFIEFIGVSHKNISDIPENMKVIQSRDSTFTIRAINPENIKSLTERAFFNSFNLDRNVLNDLEEEIKLHKNGSYIVKGKERKLNSSENTTQRRTENEEEEKCICGKNLPGSEWIQCSNEEKCRGSNWYHLECSGLDSTERENLKDINFTCDECKREDVDGESGGSEVRKRKQGEESVR